MALKWSRAFCIVQVHSVDPTAGKNTFILLIWLFGGIPGDRLDIPLSLLHVWGEEVMKVLFSEDRSSLDRCGWVPHTSEDSSHWGFQSAYYSSVTVIPPFLCAFLWCIIAQPFFLLCQWFLIFSSQTNTLSDFTSFPWMFFVPVSIQRYFCLQSLH